MIVPEIVQYISLEKTSVECVGISKQYATLLYCMPLNEVVLQTYHHSEWR